MENEEYQKRKIRTAYTEIMRRLIDRDFAFPAGGKVNIQLSKFIEQFTAYCGGAFNDARLVDYCVFQIHKNRNAKFQKNLAVTAFGQTAFNKYKAMAGKNKKYVEDKWMSEKQLDRTYLTRLIADKEHPLAKYVYMPSEEMTKKRFFNTDTGFVLCSVSTLMWSPFSETCNACNNQTVCKGITKERYPELYRLRIEEYDKERR